LLLKKWLKGVTSRVFGKVSTYFPDLIAQGDVLLQTGLRGNRKGLELAETGILLMGELFIYFKYEQHISQKPDALNQGGFAFAPVPAFYRRCE
jgi:hypothetical protein